jgi:S-formylglutathione hydrolase FrmB
LEFFEARRTIVGSQPSNKVMDTKEILRAEYRRTWEVFSRCMKKVNELQDSAEASVLAAARREADCAFAAHKNVRDRLAALLAPAPVAPMTGRIPIGYMLTAQQAKAANCR